jgi:ABC-type multidrug transport system fused ATPase/permease subunit
MDSRQFSIHLVWGKKNSLELGNLLTNLLQISTVALMVSMFLSYYIQWNLTIAIINFSIAMVPFLLISAIMTKMNIHTDKIQEKRSQDKSDVLLDDD